MLIKLYASKKAAFLPSFYRKIIVFCKLKIVFPNVPHFSKDGGKGIKSTSAPQDYSSRGVIRVIEFKNLF